MMRDENAPVDKAAYAYEEIKKIIVRGKLNSDTPLSEAFFVNRLEISRTPIRAALQRLQQEGFVRIIPKQGIVVRELGLDEAFQLLELHFVIEHYLITNSVVYLNERDYSQLSQMIEQQKEAAAGRRYDDYLMLDQKFHMFCYHHHGNKFMIDILNNFRERFYLWRYRTLKMPGRMEKSIREHEMLVELIRKGEYESAYQLMEDHMQQLRRALENKLVGMGSAQDAE